MQPEPPQEKIRYRAGEIDTLLLKPEPGSGRKVEVFEPESRFNPY